MQVSAKNSQRRVNSFPKRKKEKLTKRTAIKFDLIDEIPDITFKQTLVHKSNTELKKEFNQYAKKKSIAAGAMAGLNFIILTLLTLDYYYYYGNDYKMSTVNYALRGVSLVFTIICICLIFLRNHCQNIMSSIKVYINYQSEYHTDHSIISTVFEILIHLLINFPFQDRIYQLEIYGRPYFYTISVIFYVLSYIRLYSIFIFIKNYSYLNKIEPSRLFHIITSKNGMYSFVIKCSLKVYGLQLLLAFCVALLLLFSILINIAEDLYESGDTISNRLLNVKTKDTIDDLTSYLNSVWFIAVTITAIGYGDYNIHTVLAQLICILSCIIGNIILSFLTVYLALSFHHTETESRAFNEILNSLSLQDDSKSNINYAKKYIEYKLIKNKADLLTVLKAKQERDILRREYYRNYKRRTSKISEMSLLIDFNNNFVAKSNEILSLLQCNKEENYDNHVSS